MRQSDFIKALERASILFMDIDGVMTDGRLSYINGTVMRSWHVRDRLALKGIKTIAAERFKIVWISGHGADDIERIAGELKVDAVYQFVSNKLEKMSEVLENFGIDAANALYIGDDIVDIACMNHAAASFCPKDAVEEAKKTADYICDNRGGAGAVREIIEMIMKSKNIWEQLLDLAAK